MTCNVYMSYACPWKRFGLYPNLYKNDNQKLNGKNGRNRGKRDLNVDDEHIVKGTRDISTLASIVWGSILAMNSGYINGICLSGILSNTKQAGTAVTGAWTNSALGFARDDFEQYTFHTKCILSYITGSFLSGILNPKPLTPYISSDQQHQQKHNQQHNQHQQTMLRISVPSVQSLFFLSSVFMYFGSQLLSSSSSSYSNYENHAFLYLALICSGIQNSLTSTTTSNLIRTSHFSGISSDIGTYLGQYVRGNKENLMKLKLFLVLASSFWLGGVIAFGVLQALHVKEHSFLVSSILYAMLGLLVRCKSVVTQDDDDDSVVKHSKRNRKQNARHARR